MTRFARLALLACPLLAAFTPADCPAGKFNRVLSPGDAAPDFSALLGTDDKPHSLADFRDARLIVLIFTSNHCPVARSYEERLIQLVRDYTPQRVRFAAINSNTLDADALPAMKQRAADRRFNFPYLYDPTQATARAYGASVTPEVFVVDAAGKIAYQGAIDDNFDSVARVKHHYLRDALDALLAGRQPETRETKAKGCGIQYD